jgi:hypothetical protein
MGTSARTTAAIELVHACRTPTSGGQGERPLTACFYIEAACVGNSGVQVRRRGLVERFGA